MKKRLNELTVSQFIELVCGNETVLLNKKEKVDEDLLKTVSWEIIASYRMITDSTNLKSQLIDKEESLKIKVRILMFRMCQNLLLGNAFDEIRKILKFLDETTDDIEDSDLSKKLDELLQYALFEQHRIEDFHQEDTAGRRKCSPDDIRASFYAEIAFISTHFKMSFDINTLNAAIYANMVHQAENDIRMKKRYEMN